MPGKVIIVSQHYPPDPTTTAAIMAEIADNALVVRFKLKARPGNSGAVQDRALRQMLKGMPQLGIAFAT